MQLIQSAFQGRILSDTLPKNHSFLAEILHRFRIETISDPCTRLPSFSSFDSGTHATFRHTSALLDKLLREDITGHGSPLFDLGAAGPIGTRIAHVGTQLNTP